MFIHGLCIVFGLVVVGVVAPGGDGQYCYSCHGVQDANSCTFTHQCHHDQYCGAEVILENGSTQLHLDCFSRHDCDHSHSSATVLVGRRQANHHGVVCRQCCATDNCNKHLCSGHTRSNSTSAVLPVQPVSSPTCYSCHHEVSDPSLCTDVKTCHDDERCAMQKHVGNDGAISYKLGCKHDHDCSHHDHHDGCTQCCDGHLCNKNLCSAGAAKATPAPTLAPTVPTTAPTVAPTTTKPLMIVPTAAATPGPACKNVEEHGFSCSSFDQFNFCTDTTSFAHSMAHTNCRLHCGYCTLPAKTTAFPIPTRRARRQSAAEKPPCVDDERNGFSCASYDAFNFCTDPLSFAHPLAPERCPRHCGYCTDDED